LFIALDNQIIIPASNEPFMKKVFEVGKGGKINRFAFERRYLRRKKEFRVEKEFGALGKGVHGRGFTRFLQDCNWGKGEREITYKRTERTGRRDEPILLE